MKVVTSPLLATVAGVRHAFFTRHGGVSTGIYESLNVGRGSKDEPQDVTENRRRCAAYFGAPAEALLTCYQIHSVDVLTADSPWGDERPEADGVVTGQTGLVCGALSPIACRFC
jgi:copper oxidase (laccase) domain-containing protein